MLSAMPELREVEHGHRKSARTASRAAISLPARRSNTHTTRNLNSTEGNWRARATRKALGRARYWD
jgi:hypothetical protein